MRILIFGINFSPEETGIAPYTTGMARHLVRRGHAVDVVTGFPHYPDWQSRPDYGSALWRREVLDGVNVLRSRHFVPTRQSALMRGLYESTFLFSGLRSLRLERPDAILGVVPSLSGGILAKLAARRFGRPYGLIFQDLMGRAALESGVSGGTRVASAVSAIERWCAPTADAVAVIAEGFRPYLETLGTPPARIVRIRNWAHTESPDKDRDEVRSSLGMEPGQLLCVHAGNMGYKQGLENVVETARLAAAHGSRLQFLLVGDGSRKAALAKLVETYALNNVRFLPIQPKSEFVNLLSAADVLLVNQAGSVTEMSLPSKLSAYFFAGRPVLAAVAPESEAAKEIEASRGGRIVRPDAPAELLRALQELAADDGARSWMGQAGRQYALRNLTSDAGLAGCEEFVARVAGIPVAREVERAAA